MLPSMTNEACTHKVVVCCDGGVGPLCGVDSATNAETPSQTR